MAMASGPLLNSRALNKIDDVLIFWRTKGGGWMNPLKLFPFYKPELHNCPSHANCTDGKFYTCLKCLHWKDNNSSSMGVIKQYTFCYTVDYSLLIPMHGCVNRHCLNNIYMWISLSPPTTNQCQGWLWFTCGGLIYHYLLGVRVVESWGLE